MASSSQVTPASTPTPNIWQKPAGSPSSSSADSMIDDDEDNDALAAAVDAYSTPPASSSAAAAAAAGRDATPAAPPLFIEFPPPPPETEGGFVADDDVESSNQTDDGARSPAVLLSDGALRSLSPPGSRLPRPEQNVSSLTFGGAAPSGDGETVGAVTTRRRGTADGDLDKAITASLADQSGSSNLGDQTSSTVPAGAPARAAAVAATLKIQQLLQAAGEGHQSRRNSDQNSGVHDGDDGKSEDGDDGKSEAGESEKLDKNGDAGNGDGSEIDMTRSKGKPTDKGEGGNKDEHEEPDSPDPPEDHAVKSKPNTVFVRDIESVLSSVNSGVLMAQHTARLLLPSSKSLPDESQFKEDAITLYSPLDPGKTIHDSSGTLIPMAQFLPVLLFAVGPRDDFPQDKPYATQYWSSDAIAPQHSQVARPFWELSQLPNGDCLVAAVGVGLDPKSVLTRDASTGFPRDCDADLASSQALRNGVADWLAEIVDQRSKESDEWDEKNATLFEKLRGTVPCYQTKRIDNEGDEVKDGDGKVKTVVHNDFGDKIKHYIGTKLRTRIPLDQTFSELMAIKNKCYIAEHRFRSLEPKIFSRELRLDASRPGGMLGTNGYHTWLPLGVDPKSNEAPFPFDRVQIIEGKTALALSYTMSHRSDLKGTDSYGAGHCTSLLPASDKLLSMWADPHTTFGPAKMTPVFYSGNVKTFHVDFHQVYAISADPHAIFEPLRVRPLYTLFAPGHASIDVGKLYLILSTYMQFRRWGTKDTMDAVAKYTAEQLEDSEAKTKAAALADLNKWMENRVHAEDGAYRASANTELWSDIGDPRLAVPYMACLKMPISVPVFDNLSSEAQLEQVRVFLSTLAVATAWVGLAHEIEGIPIPDMPAPAHFRELRFAVDHVDQGHKTVVLSADPKDGHVVGELLPSVLIKQDALQLSTQVITSLSQWFVKQIASEIGAEEDVKVHWTAFCQSLIDHIGPMPVEALALVKTVCRQPDPLWLTSGARPDVALSPEVGRAEAAILKKAHEAEKKLKADREEAATGRDDKKKPPPYPVDGKTLLCREGQFDFVKKLKPNEWANAESELVEYLTAFCTHSKTTRLIQISATVVQAKISSLFVRCYDKDSRFFDLIFNVRFHALSERETNGKKGHKDNLTDNFVDGHNVSVWRPAMLFWLLLHDLAFVAACVIEDTDTLKGMLDNLPINNLKLKIQPPKSCKLWRESPPYACLQPWSQAADFKYPAAPVAPEKKPRSTKKVVKDDVSEAADDDDGDVASKAKDSDESTRKRGRQSAAGPASASAKKGKATKETATPVSDDEDESAKLNSKSGKANSKSGKANSSTRGPSPSPARARNHKLEESNASDSDAMSAHMKQTLAQHTTQFESLLRDLIKNHRQEVATLTKKQEADTKKLHEEIKKTKVEQAKLTTAASAAAKRELDADAALPTSKKAKKDDPAAVADAAPANKEVEEAQRKSKELQDKLTALENSTAQRAAASPAINISGHTRSAPPPGPEEPTAKFARLVVEQTLIQLGHPAGAAQSSSSNPASQFGAGSNHGPSQQQQQQHPPLYPLQQQQYLPLYPQQQQQYGPFGMYPFNAPAFRMLHYSKAVNDASHNAMMMQAFGQ